MSPRPADPAAQPADPAAQPQDPAAQPADLAARLAALARLSPPALVAGALADLVAELAVARRWTEAAAVAVTIRDPVLRVRALLAAASGPADPLLDEARSLAARLAAPQARAQALRQVAVRWAEVGHPQVEEVLAEATTQAAQLAEPWERDAALAAVALVWAHAGQSAHGLRLLFRCQLPGVQRAGLQQLLDALLRREPDGRALWPALAEAPGEIERRLLLETGVAVARQRGLADLAQRLAALAGTRT
ncbi:MAG: hypothetical protein RBU45_08990 [Myxococcota bacterium]|nr:hypothetical protein [Myxococcota bacterium]